jgi:hypothetical protein
MPKLEPDRPQGEGVKWSAARSHDVSISSTETRWLSSEASTIKGVAFEKLGTYLDAARSEPRRLISLVELGQIPEGRDEKGRES